jgi:hypothetical protein
VGITKSAAVQADEAPGPDEEDSSTPVCDGHVREDVVQAAPADNNKGRMGTRRRAARPAAGIKANSSGAAAAPQYNSENVTLTPPEPVLVPYHATLAEVRRCVCVCVLMWG